MVTNVTVEATVEGWRVSVFITNRAEPVVMFVDREDTVEEMALNSLNFSGKFLDVQADMAAGL